MPRTRALKSGGSPNNPLRYRAPTDLELKQARRHALGYMGIEGGLSQADAARIMGRPRRWWQGMEFTKSARSMSFSDWALFSIFALGESPAKFSKFLPPHTNLKAFTRTAFMRAVKGLDIRHVECRRDPNNYCYPSKQEIIKLRTGIQTPDGQEISKAKAAAIIGRSPRWWQKLEQPAVKGSTSTTLGFSDYALIRILAYGDDPALYAVALKRVLLTRKTGYQANIRARVPLIYRKHRGKHKKAA